MFERATPVEFPGEWVPDHEIAEIEAELNDEERAEFEAELARIKRAEVEAAVEVHYIQIGLYEVEPPRALPSGDGMGEHGVCFTFPGTKEKPPAWIIEAARGLVPLKLEVLENEDNSDNSAS